MLHGRWTDITNPRLFLSQPFHRADKIFASKAGQISDDCRVVPKMSCFHSSCHGESHTVSHVFRSDQVCWFVQVCSILFRPQLPHILKAMSKAAGKGSVPPPPPSGMITMEAESIPSKSLERKGAWRSWTILNNMTLVKRKHRSSWIILFSLHFSVIAVRFVAVFWFLQHLQLGGYGKSAGKASGKAAGKGSQDKSSALSTWSRFTFRNFLNISFCSFTASAFFLRYSMLFVRVRFCSSCASFLHLSSCWWCYCCASAPQNTCCLQSLAQCRTLPDSILGAFIKLVVRRLTGEEISVQTE